MQQVVVKFNSIYLYNAPVANKPSVHPIMTLPWLKLRRIR